MFDNVYVRLLVIALVIALLYVGIIYLTKWKSFLKPGYTDKNKKLNWKKVWTWTAGVAVVVFAIGAAWESMYPGSVPTFGMGCSSCDYGMEDIDDLYS